MPRTEPERSRKRRQRRCEYIGRRRRRSGIRCGQAAGNQGRAGLDAEHEPYRALCGPRQRIFRASTAWTSTSSSPARRAPTRWSRRATPNSASATRKASRWRACKGVPLVSIAAVIQHNTSGFASPADEEHQVAERFRRQNIRRLGLASGGSGHRLADAGTTAATSARSKSSTSATPTSSPR